MKLLSYLGEVWKCLKMEINRKWGGSRKKERKNDYFNEVFK